LDSAESFKGVFSRRCGFTQWIRETIRYSKHLQKKDITFLVAESRSKLHPKTYRNIVICKESKGNQFQCVGVKTGYPSTNKNALRVTLKCLRFPVMLNGRNPECQIALGKASLANNTHKATCFDAVSVAQSVS